jgi:hypothetical protein
MTAHLLSSLLRVAKYQTDPTEIEGVALVDEVDLHLHPAWQAHAVKDFRQTFPRLQLIATTHSPLVIGSLTRNQLLIVRRSKEGDVVIDSPDLSPRGLGVAGILTSSFDLGSTLDQITLDKITRRLELNSRRHRWSERDRCEHDQLSEELSELGFNRDYSDPYAEQFAVALARRHKAVTGMLTPEEKTSLSETADRLVAEIIEKSIGA